VVAVTVLEDRASITRRGDIALVATQQRVVIERVSPILADKTLTATCTNARILDVRCERYVAPWRETDGTGEPAALRAERQKLDIPRDAAAAKATTARAEADAIAQLIGASLSDLAVAAARGVATPNVAAQIAELDTLETAARKSSVDADLALEDLATQIGRLDDRIVKAEAEAGEKAARLVIDLAADRAGQ